MDWVIGLYLFGIIATLASVGWFITYIDYITPQRWHRYDIRPIIMWLKMVATIFWLTFFGLLGLHFWIGG